MMPEERDYYCNNKFKFLKVDIEKNTTYNCHAAKPHRINLDWLRANPGEIFNTEVNVSERQQMLRNERNASCEQNCWRAEDQGGSGPRILERGYQRTHFEVRTQPEIIDITLGGDCNLKCVYCCKEFSSSWRNELVNHGPYQDVGETDRFTIVPKDQLLMSKSQKEKSQSAYYQTILSELQSLAPHAKNVIITGGEPLLYNTLHDVVLSLAGCKDIKIFTGLGVTFKRFARMIEKLMQIPEVRFCISIENTGDLYEFNRRGMRWPDAEKKISFLRDIGAKVSMHSTLTNLTLFGFADFYEKVGSQYHLEIDFAHNPSFMPVYVMDDASKTMLSEWITHSDVPVKNRLLETLAISPSEQQRNHLGSFLRQFQQRNSDVDIKIFPKTFLDWLI